MKTAFLFPGQGAQKVGMGKDLYEAYPAAAAIFDQAEQATGLEIKRLCFEGPAEDLDRTDNAQPAIFTVSAAVAAVVADQLGPDRRREVQPTYAAGLSLGEYTALYVAGSMDFVTGVKLVARRGELMQAAAQATPSGMVAVMGLDEAAAEQLVAKAADGQVLSCANFNCPGQIVLTGETAACQRAAEMAEQFGAAGAKVLSVAGAFHSEIMSGAAEKFAEDLAAVRFAEPAVATLSNLDAAVYGGSDEITGKLLAQLTSPVRWQQCMEHLLAKGVEAYYEVGPGRVLAGLMRRLDRKTKVVCLNSCEAIGKLVG